MNSLGWGMRDLVQVQMRGVPHLRAVTENGPPWSVTARHE